MQLLSPKQLTMLKRINGHMFTADNAEKFDNRTLYSLYKRGFVTFKGIYLVITRAGQKFLFHYSNYNIYRKHRKKLVERLMRAIKRKSA